VEICFTATRILVVDDNEVMLRSVCRMLHRIGYEVVSAASPREALEVVTSNPPFDLVVSDNHMPDGQGTNLVREIVRLSPRTACLIMTGAVLEPADVPDGVSILRKPFNTADLIDAVQTTLARSRNAQS
jgi:CheY-like chemotaxis protein